MTHEQAWLLFADEVYSITTGRAWLWTIGAPLAHTYDRRARA